MFVGNCGDFEGGPINIQDYEPPPYFSELSLLNISADANNELSSAQHFRNCLYALSYFTYFSSLGFVGLCRVELFSELLNPHLKNLGHSTIIIAHDSFWYLMVPEEAHILS